MVDGRTLLSSPDDLLDRAGAELANAVYRTANCLLALPADAEEVTLDVLVSLDARTRELGPDALEAWLDDLPAWLEATTIGKAKPRAKRRRRHAKRLDELALLADSLDPELSAAKRRAALVKEVLSYLPRRHRFIYILGVGLGHDDDDLAARLGADLATVTRSREAIAARLREFATHTLEQRALLGDLAQPGPSNPIHDYVREHGAIDPQLRARLLRRLAATVNHGPNSMEMSGDSMFDAQLSGFAYPSPVTDGLDGAASVGADPDVDAALASAPELYLRQRRWPVVLFGTASVLLLLAVLASEAKTQRQLARLDEAVESLASRDAGPQASAGPRLLEPGKFFDLAYDGRAEPSKDGQVELLRSDAKGAEFRLLAGSISFHVNPTKGVQWIVHDGRYDISAAGKRFRVTHTGAVPEVEVFDGKVVVSGGLLGGEGVEVRSTDRTLAAVMAARGQAPLAELELDADQTPNSLALDELFARAISLREAEPKEAEDLFRAIEIRGGADWISERAFDQLRTLVAPDERAELATSYAARFPDGAFREPFAAIHCQGLELQDEAESCWLNFTEQFPTSLYGP